MSKESIEQILQDLKSPDSRIRQEAARRLGELGDARAVNALIHTLQHDKTESVRFWAAISLSKLKTTRAVDALIAAFLHDRHDVKWAATRGLIQIKSPHVVNTLVYVVRHSDDQNARQIAIEALSHCKEAPVLNLLIHVLQHDNNPDMRRAAASALGQFGVSKAVTTLNNALRYESSAEVRLAIVEALEKLNDPQTIDTLLYALQHDENEWVRGAAALTISKLDAKRALNPLLQALQDSSPYVRRATAEALGYLAMQTGHMETALQAIKTDVASTIEGIKRAVLDNIAIPNFPQIVLDVLRRHPAVRRNAALRFTINEVAKQLKQNRARKIMITPSISKTDNSFP